MVSSLFITMGEGRLKGEGVEISRMEKFIRCFGLEEAGVKGGRERSSETENFRRIVLNCLN